MCLKASRSIRGNPSPILLRRFRKKARARVQTASSKRRKNLNYKLQQKNGSIMVEEEMEMVNLKLYLKNRCIMEENKKLREKAFLLRQENQALLYHLVNGPIAATTAPP